MSHKQSLQQLNSVELVERVHGDDEAAINELCRRYLPRLWTRARVRLGATLRQRMEDRDVVQDVFLSVAKKQLKDFQFRDEYSLINYLGDALENKIRDQAEHHRRKKRDVRRDQPMASPHSNSAAGGVTYTTPSQIVSRQEDLLQLELAMDRLKKIREDYWELIVAKELVGQPIVDLAKEMGENPDTIRMRTNRAKEMLRDFMENPVPVKSAPVLDGKTET